MTNTRRDMAYITTIVLGFGITILCIKIGYMQDTIDSLQTPVNTVYKMIIDCMDGMTGVYVHASNSGRLIDTIKPVSCEIRFTK